MASGSEKDKSWSRTGREDERKGFNPTLDEERGDNVEFPSSLLYHSQLEFHINCNFPNPQCWVDTVNCWAQPGIETELLTRKMWAPTIVRAKAFQIMN